MVKKIIKQLTTWVTLGALLYFCVVPIAAVIIYGLGSDTNDLDLSLISRNLPLLKNSLVLAACSTTFSVILAVIATFSLHRLEYKGRTVGRLLMLLPLINPAFIGSLSYIMLFGTRGLITRNFLGLSVSPYGMHSIVFLEVMSYSTLAYLIISGSINNSNINLEDAARTLGASEKHILTHISLPLMIPEITVAALLTFFASMADFTTPVVIGGNFHTLASDLYIQIIGVYDMQTASITGIFLLVPCVLAFFVQRHIAKNRKYANDLANSRDIVYRHCPRMLKAFCIVTTTVVTMLFTLMFAFIIIGAFTKSWGHDYTLTLQHASEVLSKGFRQYLKPLRNSVLLALTTGLVTSGAGVILAWLIHERKLRHGWLFEFACVLPASVPGILFGIGYLVTFKYSLFGIGQFILPDAPKIVLLGTTFIVYAICIARQMNLSMKSCYALLDHIEPEILEACYTLGASPTYTTMHILVPMLKDAFMNAFLRIFAATMSTLGAIVFLIMPSNKVIIQILFQTISTNSIGVSCFVAVLLSTTTLFLMIVFYCLAYSKEIFRALINKIKHKTQKKVEL